MKIRSPILMKLAAAAFTTAIWLLFRTLRMEFREETPGSNPYSESTRSCFFYCVWHDSMLIPAFGGKHRRTAALTSQHMDGSFVAQVLRLVHIETIRGSTNRISSGTIRTLIKTAADKHIVITPDGPRGPGRKMSVGIVYLASRTGRAIIPTAYSCSRCWRIRGSWTDLIIPKPFAKVFFLAAPPVQVPAELDTADLQEHVTSVQAEMDRIDVIAQGLAKGDGGLAKGDGGLAKGEEVDQQDGSE